MLTGDFTVVKGPTMLALFFRILRQLHIFWEVTIKRSPRISEVLCGELVVLNEVVVSPLADIAADGIPGKRKLVLQ